MQSEDEWLDGMFSQIEGYRASVRPSSMKLPSSTADSVATRAGPYPYRPLDQQKNDIRVLHILPNADRRAPIECELVHKPLGNSTYLALSYCWGTGPPSSAIILNGHRFSVSDSLHAALLTLRNPDEPLNIWIDAVCMNQADLEERSREVLRMRSIYTRAHRVVIWLGPEEFDSKRALDHLQALAERRSKLKSAPPPSWLALSKSFARLPFLLLRVIYQTATDSPFFAGLGAYCVFALLAGSTSHWVGSGLISWLVKLGAILAWCRLLFGVMSLAFGEDESVPRVPLIINDVAALRDFFGCEWFGRTWIIQELAVARRATFVRGDLAIDSERVTRACGEIRRIISYSKDSMYLRCNYQRFTFLGRFQDVRNSQIGNSEDDLVVQRWGQYQSGLQYLLSAFSPMDSTDSRDKVYGILGLSPEDSAQSACPAKVIPDYSLNVVQVYTRVAQTLIERNRNLDVLSACLGTGTVSHLPSWVADWTAKIHRPIHVVNQKAEPYAVPISRPLYTFSNNGKCLRVSGFIVGVLMQDFPALRDIQSNLTLTNLSSQHALAARLIDIVFFLLHHFARILPYLALTPGLSTLLRSIANANPLGLGHVFVMADDLRASMRRGTRVDFPRTFRALQSSYNSHGAGQGERVLISNGFRVGLDEKLKREPGMKGLCTTYADARRGDLLVMLIGAKQPCIVRSRELEGETEVGEQGYDNHVHYEFVGPAECAGFWLQAIMWKTLRAKFERGEVELVDFQLS